MIGKHTILALREIKGPLMVLDEARNLVHVDEGIAHLLGRTVVDLRGRALTEFACDNPDRLGHVLNQFASTGDWIAGLLTLRGPDGEAMEFPCQGKVLQRPQGEYAKLIVLRRSAHAGFLNLNNRIKDVQAEMRRRHEAEFQLNLASFAIDHATDPMYWLDCDSRIELVNEQTCRLLGYSREELLGMRIPEIDPECTEEIWQAHWRQIREEGPQVFERTLRRKDGSAVPVEVSATFLRFQGRELDFVVTRDISERKKAEQTINTLAFYDRLTGLPNRTLLLDRLKQAMATTVRSRYFGALLLIDLDHFKTLNDTRGHDVGDMLLTQVAQKLGECIRDSDTLARIGGDEFVALLTELSTVETEAAGSSEFVAEKFLASLRKPFMLGDLPHHGSASIGVTLFHGQTTSIDDLMKQADLAMYKAKSAGRNAIRFFDPTLESAIQEHAALEHDMRQALAKEQFCLHYQPQIADNRLTGAEALIRWQHPGRGLVSPIDFIPLAEETGLILPLGNWVLETACRLLAAWAERPRMSHLTIAINVSALQFGQPDFVEQVLNTVKRTGAKPQQLKLELTESLLVQDVDEVIEKMFALKAKGVGFSLDDFGTGYSSLAYLKRLPLDQLKIDRSFVRDVLTDPNDASIARTIIALAQNLGLGVIAEGVETEAQQQFLANSGCHAYQGYLFSKPLPIEDFEAFVQRT